MSQIGTEVINESVVRKWKRYPAYKDSGVEWLGEIPAHWEVKRVKYVFRVINGSTPKSGVSEYWDGDITWVTPDDLGHLNSDTIVETSRKISQAGYVSCGTTLAPAGSLVLSTRAPIGHLAIARVELCTNQGCRSLVFRSNDDCRYFYYQIFSARPELESWGQGSTFQELGKGKLESILLARSPLSEQQAIASFLDRETAKIDILIAKKGQLIQLLQEKRTALISHAVTKGLNPDAPMKDSGVEWLGEVPAHWKVKKLKTLCSVVKDGLHETPPKVAEGVPFISTQHVRNRHIYVERATFISRDDYDKGHPRIAPTPGDVLITLVGSIGFAAILEPDIYPISFTRHVGYVRPKSNLNASYLLNYVESIPFKTFIDLEVSQVAQPSIYLRSLAEHIIPAPPRDEQDSIVVLLDRETAKIDALIGKIRTGVEHLKEYRTAFISSAVTGKIDVCEIANAS